MLTPRSRLVAVLFAVAVVAVAAAADLGSDTAPDERPLPSDDASVRAEARSDSEPAVVRDTRNSDDRFSRVLRPDVAVAVLVALVSALAATRCRRVEPHLTLRHVACSCAAPRGPPVRLA